MIGRIIRVGLPQAMEITGMWLIHAFSIRIISGLNNGGALGAHIIAIRAESMSFLPGFAIGTAAATLAGQYLGAGSRVLAAHAVKLCWALAAVMMGVMGMLFVFARHEIVALMAPDSELHVRLAAPLLVVCGLSQPFFATCIVLKTAMRGTGATGLVMRWSFGSMFFFRVVILWTLHHLGWLDLTGVWLVMTADMITQAVVFARLHFRGDWLDARV
jgi:Na+-driven multidrug efflux pump